MNSNEGQRERPIRGCRDPPIFDDRRSRRIARRDRSGGSGCRVAAFGPRLLYPVPQWRARHRASSQMPSQRPCARRSGWCSGTFRFRSCRLAPLANDPDRSFASGCPFAPWGELTTGMLAKDASFRLVVSGNIGVKKIECLIQKLEIDKEILAELPWENKEAAN